MSLIQGKVPLTVRRRKYSYRTEQSYLVWIERLARHLGTEDLAAQGEAQIAEFLDSLALNENLSASSQRQALNALVFLYREVFGKELGDFSDFRRAKVRTHLPVWLTRDELQRFFACLDDKARLMAQVMYGSGLRLMELLRLRVKDLDLKQEILTVRGGKGDNYAKVVVMERCSSKALQRQGTVRGELSITLSSEEAESAVDATENRRKEFSETSEECGLATQKPALANSRQLLARS